MIRATELSGRTVVDLDAAEKLGKIDRVVLDPDARRLAGFVVSRGSPLFGGGEHLTLPASCIHAIGPDAVTVRRGTIDGSETNLEGRPCVSDMVGRKVVSEQGRLLGKIDDVLIDERDGRILGYGLSAGDFDDKLRSMMGQDRKDGHRAPYLRAEANLRTGRELVVAPEDAVADDWHMLEDSAPATPDDAAEPRDDRATASAEAPPSVDTMPLGSPAAPTVETDRQESQVPEPEVWPPTMPDADRSER